MSERVPRAARWILAVATRIVPVHRRPTWRRQWEAELEHRCSEDAPGGGLIRHAVGSVAHALYLRREEMTMRGWAADLRQSARALLSRPGFALLTIATLAVGIGSATAIFSLAEALILRPLPLDDSDRLVRLYSMNATRGFGRFSVSYPDFVDFTSRSDLFEAASLYTPRNQDIAGELDPERVRTVAVHTGYFQLLESPIALGRAFLRDDHRLSAAPTAILAASFWASRFGADSTVVGRTIRLDGVPHTVVGVVEDRYAWPKQVQLWTPLQWGGAAPDYVDVRSNHSWQVVARLHPGVEVEEASGQVRAMARTIYEGPAIEERERGTESIVVPLHSSEGGEDAAALFGTLGAAVLLVLLIACMNASGLLLTRAWGRSRELSVRSALGAGRGRLVAVLLGESTVLALLGGVVGVALGQLGLERAFAMVPPEIVTGGEIELNATVLSAGIAISLAAALLAGLVPALRASKLSIADALRDGSAQAGQAGASTRLRRGLVVTELAFSLALLVGAGLTIRGFQRQLAADPGFEASSLLSFTVRLPSSRYGEDALADAYYAQAVERLEADPSVVAATATSRLPLGAGGLSLGRAFIFDGATPPPDGAEFFGSWVEVDPGYFEAVGIPLNEGRAFTADDRGDAPLVAIVNERFARQLSPDESIVGRVIRSFYDENLPRTVVGVMPDVQFGGVSRAQRSPLVLVPRAQSPRRSMAFLVRTREDPAEAMAAVRRVMAQIDGDVALDQLQPLREAHASDLAGIRFLTTLFGTFGILALLLAVSGVYGLVSYSVSQRRQEIGVRMAMGASGGSVRAEVLRESAVLGVIGLGLGLGLAYVAGRVVSAGMDGIATMEPSTYVGVVLLLGAAVLAATWVPAARATRVDPVEALRAE